MNDPTIEAAFALDAALVKQARGRGAIDLALGETLLRLFRGDHLISLGFSREKDYAHERLGVPARTVFAWTRLARGLAERPLLRRAVVCGAVSPRKALTVMPVATGDAEATWTAAAMNTTLADLEKRVRAAGAEPLTGLFAVETLIVSMSPEQQDRLDAAIATAREVLGHAAPRWQCVEAICMEWLGAFAGYGPEVGELEEESARNVSEAWLRKWARKADSLDRLLAATEEATELVKEEAGAADETARSLDARVLRLLEARRGFDEPFGRLLESVVGGKVYRLLGYRTLEEYCRERLGMSSRGVRQRVWLERKMRALPEIRAALGSGEITFSKALILAKDANRGDVTERIARAKTTTHQQAERESDEEEDRKNRALGVRRLWGPEDAFETLALAIGSAQAYAASLGERIDAGEALAVMGDHFVGVWTEHLRRRKVPKGRKEVLRRTLGICAVPGCTRAAEHEHHVRFRSRGGSDEAANKVGLCAPCHLRGVHRGVITVEGIAGERLLWRLGISGDGEAASVWVTEGDDDVRRVG